MMNDGFGMNLACDLNEMVSIKWDLVLMWNTNDELVWIQYLDMNE